MTDAIKKLLLYSVCLSAVLYMIAAYNSQTYYHPDEHFQIVEFAANRLGITPTDNMAWEFAARIRPAFQPALCYFGFKAQTAIGITDHYMQTMMLRMLTGLCSLLAIWLFCYANLSEVSPSLQRYYVLITFFFWFPYMYGGRFSSETCSGICILLGISLLQLHYRQLVRWPEWLVYAVTGLLIGMAFLFRFQVAFFIVGLGLWLMIIRRARFESIAILTLSALLVLGFGTLVDRWFYGEWVCTPWLYFESNLIKGVASSFGTEPFYQYLLWLFTGTTPLIGVLIIAASFIYFYQAPRSIYTWILIPFLLGHSAIGHKEFRFIFPMINSLPILFIMTWQQYADRISAWWQGVGRITRLTLLFLVVASNFVMILIEVILPNELSTDPKRFAYKLHAMAKHEKIQICYLIGDNSPYFLDKGIMNHKLYQHFYDEPAIDNFRLDNYCQMDSLPRAGFHRMIATSRYEMQHDSCLARYKPHYVMALRSLPEWIEHLPYSWGGDSLQTHFDKSCYFLLFERDTIVR